MSRGEAYKDYVIDIIRESNDSWKAKVTCEDGALNRLKYGTDRSHQLRQARAIAKRTHSTKPRA